MAEDNIDLVLNFLTNNKEYEVLPLNKDTLSKLIQKYPKGKTVLGNKKSRTATHWGW